MIFRYRHIYYIALGFLSFLLGYTFAGAYGHYWFLWMFTTPYLVAGFAAYNGRISEIPISIILLYIVLYSSVISMYDMAVRLSLPLDRSTALFGLLFSFVTVIIIYICPVYLIVRYLFTTPDISIRTILKSLILPETILVITVTVYIGEKIFTHLMVSYAAYI